MRISDWSSDVCSSDLSSAATGNSGYGLDIGEGAVVIMCVEQAQIAGNFHPIPGNCRRFQLKTCDLSVARIQDVLRRCPIDHRGDLALNVALTSMENGDIGSPPFVEPVRLVTTFIIFDTLWIERGERSLTKFEHDRTIR